VPEQRLDDTNVRARFEQMSGKAMAQHPHCHLFGEARITSRPLAGTLHGRCADGMAWLSAPFHKYVSD